MSTSDGRDFRAYFPEFSSFSMTKVLSELEHRAIRKKESTMDVVSRNIEYKK